MKYNKNAVKYFYLIIIIPVFSLKTQVHKMKSECSSRISFDPTILGSGSMARVTNLVSRWMKLAATSRSRTMYIEVVQRGFLYILSQGGAGLLSDVQ